MSTPKILILMGVSGSGKTKIGQQLAKELGWNFFDGDDFHPPDNIEKMSQGIPLTDDNRNSWLYALETLIHQQITTNQPAIMACSALRQAYRDRLKVTSSVQFVYLKGNYALIYQRLQKRNNHYMPADLLDSQFDTLEEPKDALVIDISKAPGIIVRTIKQAVFN
jgi:carbohydrate kinase (thermoresistant glucokinase family)